MPTSSATGMAATLTASASSAADLAPLPTGGTEQIRVLALVAAIGFVVFLIWESREKHPIVNLRVFRHRGFTASVVTVSAGFGAMFASNVLTPLWLQSYMGYTATWAGYACAWSGVLAVFAAPRGRDFHRDDGLGRRDHAYACGAFRAGRQHR